VTVSVVSPEVKDFSADPHDVDDNQPVTLRWHTAHADKAVLTGPSLREELSPQSDKANPKTLVPKFGGRYWLRPYKGDVSGQAIELPYAFNDLEIVRFEASPPAVLVPVHAGKETTITPAPSTWLSWAVRNARSVSYAGTTIATSGPVSMGQSIAEVAAPTTYELVATYIDGTTTQRRELTVGVRRLQAAFVVDGSRSQAFVDLTLAAGAESGVRITGSYLTWPGAPRAVDLGAATLDRVGDQWRGRVAVGEWTPQRYAPSFICNYVLAGGVPTTVGNDLIVLG
jgi:hypothetical protein